MKRFLPVCVLTVLCLAAVAAQDASAQVNLTKPAEEINLGKFPLGKWLDDRWNGLWVFTSDDISLYKNGELVYDFKGKVKDFSVKAGTGGLTVSFSCDETKRSYQFTKDISLNKDITMTINRYDTHERYKKNLTYQK